MGAFIGSALTLFVVKITQRHEARRSKLEELKKMYLDFMTSVDKINTGNTGINKDDADNLMRSLNTFALLGSDNICRKTAEVFQRLDIEDPQKREEIVYRFNDEIVPLMNQELKDFENALWSIRKL